MKVSFDLDGVLRYHPFFRRLAMILKAEGFEVGILSCQPPEPLSFKYDFWYRAKRLNEAQSKAKIIVEQGIDISFDDKGTEITKVLKRLRQHTKHLVLSNYSRFTAKMYV